MSELKPKDNTPERVLQPADRLPEPSRFSADTVSSLTDGVLKPSEAKRIQKAHGEPVDITCDASGEFSANYKDGTTVKWQGETVTITEPGKNGGKAIITVEQRQADGETVLKNTTDENTTDGKGRLTQSILDKEGHETIVNRPGN